MEKKLPTDPLADASTGVVRRSRGAFLKKSPMVRVERRDPHRGGRYTGPERREKDTAETAEAESSSRIFGFPRWLVVAGGIYLVALILVVVLIFTW